MARTQDELRQVFNSGTATDADMDEYINAGYDYNVLGPKSKTLYDQRKAELSKTVPTDTPKANTTTDPAKERLIATMPTKETGNLKKQLREQYANDNEGYAKALKDNNIAVSNPSGKVRSIQEAYYDGGIDKSTRDYMMADAVAKFARNTGRDIGNIGAQFTGGTINNNYETPAWNDRNTELFKQQTSAEAAGIKGSEANIKRQKDLLDISKAKHGQAASELMANYKNSAKDKANELRKKGDNTNAAIMETVAGEFALLESGALSSVDAEDHIANALAGIGRAVATGAITAEEAEEYRNKIQAAKGSVSPNINIGLPTIDTAVQSTVNPTVEQQADKGVVRNFADSQVKGTTFNSENVKSDIARTVQSVAAMDPKSKEYRNTLKNLYQQAGGKKDQHTLFELARNGLIDKELDIPGLTFTSGKEGDYNMIMEQCNKWANDPKWMEEHRSYMMDFSNR